MSASLVSAKTLVNPCPPPLTMALHPSNPDYQIWFKSYTEEFKGIQNCDIYGIITEKEYFNLRHQSGNAIPSMCILTIKLKDGYPHRAKSRIVVLGNREQRLWSRSDRYSPTLTQTQLRSLIALAVQHKRALRQGDVKNAFCNGILPTTETVVVKPPVGCPFSTPNTSW